MEPNNALAIYLSEIEDIILKIKHSNLNLVDEETYNSYISFFEKQKLEWMRVMNGTKYDLSAKVKVISITEKLKLNYEDYMKNYGNKKLRDYNSNEVLSICKFLSEKKEDIVENLNKIFEIRSKVISNISNYNYIVDEINDMLYTTYKKYAYITKDKKEDIFNIIKGNILKESKEIISTISEDEYYMNLKNEIRELLHFESIDSDITLNKIFDKLVLMNNPKELEPKEDEYILKLEELKKDNYEFYLYSRIYLIKLKDELNDKSLINFSIENLLEKANDYKTYKTKFESLSEKQRELLEDKEEFAIMELYQKRNSHPKFYFKEREGIKPKYLESYANFLQYFYYDFDSSMVNDESNYENTELLSKLILDGVYDDAYVNQSISVVKLKEKIKQGLEMGDKTNNIWILQNYNRIFLNKDLIIPNFVSNFEDYIVYSDEYNTSVGATSAFEQNIGNGRYGKTKCSLVSIYKRLSDYTRMKLDDKKSSEFANLFLGKMILLHPLLEKEEFIKTFYNELLITQRNISKNSKYNEAYFGPNIKTHSSIQKSSYIVNILQENSDIFDNLDIQTNFEKDQNKKNSSEIKCLKNYYEDFLQINEFFKIVDTKEKPNIKKK